MSTERSTDPEPGAGTPEAVEGVAETEVGGSPALPKRRVVLLAVMALVVFALDLTTKIIAVATLEGREPLRLAGGALYLSLIRNPGAAFGIAEGMTWVLTLIAVGVVGFIVYIAGKLRSVGWAIGLGLVLGGALGNLADRIFRGPGVLHGHVVDFLSLFDPYGRVWPVFNIADSAICAGGALIVIMALLQRDYDGTHHSKKDVA